ncbi:MAG TPA: DinB family protein [Bryobacteraceae bacterium]|nr:DinB family protein [Bryobacteraceae bacterium]
MNAKAAQKETAVTMLVNQWTQLGRKVAELADAFPEDKYETTPANGVRTFGSVLRHLAFWNQYVADTARGKKAEDAANELPLAEYATKAKIVKALKQTTDEAAAALGEHANEQNLKIAELAVSFIGHTAEHYGQLVVYSRLAGIVPPASRG